MTDATPDHPGAERIAEAAPGDGDKRLVIKKYANRRLYNTGSSSYVTLDHLADMVRQGVDFVVYDARTNEDITRQVLNQIIFEAENSSQNLLPIQFLRQLIQFYGNSVQGLLPRYLEMSLAAFASQQDRMREQVGAGRAAGFAGADGYRLFEEQVRQNMALFERAMNMFTPFAYARAGEAAPQPAPSSPAPSSPAPASTADDGGVAELKERMDALQRQIEALARKA